MVTVTEVYEATQDLLLTTDNGESPFDLFNRFSKQAELKLIDWLTGDIYGVTPPEPYANQKTKDFASPFIRRQFLNVVNGALAWPSDYYMKENLYLLNTFDNDQTACDIEESEFKEVCNIPIVELDSDQFDTRCQTYIPGLKPSFKKPICKQLGKTFEFKPQDIGNVGLEYYRYPKFGKIVKTHDATFNEDIIDVNASTNYEWDLKAIPILVFFIVDLFSNRTSNKSMKEFNLQTGKTPKG